MDERELVIDVFQSVFKPSPKEPVNTWADDKVYLDEKQSAELARYDSSKTPWAREIMDAIRHCDSVNEIHCMKASRTGISEAAYNIIRYMPANVPGNVLVALNTVEKIRDVFPRDLEPSLRVLAEDYISANANDITSTRIRLKHMTIKGTGSGSPSLFRGEWYRYALLDEIEDHEVLADGTTYDLIKSRFATVSEYLLMCIGKPQKSGGPMHVNYLKGTQEKWLVPCPRCAAEIELKWQQMRYEHCRENEEWNLERVERETFYQCQVCGEKIEAWEKKGMVAAGRWVATPKKFRDLLEGKPVAQEPRVRSFHISALYSPFPQVSWGRLAQMWIACAHINKSRAKMDDFRMDKLGLPVNRKQLNIVSEVIEGLRGGYTETVNFEARDDSGNIETRTRAQTYGEPFALCYDSSGNRIADLPCDPIFITIAIDKQDDCLKFVVFAWQRDGQSWLIDFGRFPNETELLRVMPSRKYIWKDGKTRVEHTIYGGVMDRGFRKQVVYQTCRRAQHTGWQLHPCLGWGQENERYTSDSLTESTDTITAGVKIKYYKFHDHSVKIDLYFGAIQDRAEPRLWLPTPVPPDITTELTAEIWDSDKARFIHPKDAAPNDYADCIKMQRGVVWPILSGAINQPTKAR